MNLDQLATIANKKISASKEEELNFKSLHLTAFGKNGFKEKIQDSYKFTKLDSFLKDFEISDQVRDFSDLKAENEAVIYFKNGTYIQSNKIPPGISIKKIKDHFENIKDQLIDFSPLSHLHHALLNDGIIIDVDKNAIIETPVYLRNEICSDDITAPSLFINSQANSKVTFIEENIFHKGISHFAIGETYVQASPGSNIEYINIDHGSDQSLNHSTLIVHVERDAAFKSLIFTGQGKLNRKNLVINLNASGARGESYSLFMTNKKDHCDINTEIIHKSADSSSGQIAKGIISDESKAIFTGKILILPHAQRVNSSQLNKNLLLSKKAQIHSQPQLEIFADDVKCSHGSTTGQLSDDEVFYFEARGIPAEKAKKILALGFGLEIVQKIQNKDAFEYIKKIIKAQLDEKFQTGQIL